MRGTRPHISVECGYAVTAGWRCLVLDPDAVCRARDGDDGDDDDAAASPHPAPSPGHDLTRGHHHRRQVRHHGGGALTEAGRVRLQYYTTNKIEQQEVIRSLLCVEGKRFVSALLGKGQVGRWRHLSMIRIFIRVHSMIRSLVTGVLPPSPHARWSVRSGFSSSARSDLCGVMPRAEQQKPGSLVIIEMHCEGDSDHRAPLTCVGVMPWAEHQNRGHK
jgi:hypothetical protein